MNFCMQCDFTSLATPGVRHLNPYEPGKPLEELERELGIRHTLKLASNENPLGPSARAVKVMEDQLGSVSVYPDGNGFALKNALAKSLHVTSDRITLGNGSNEILELIARTFLAPGTEAVYSEHAFAVYPIVTQAVGATARVAQANGPEHPMPYGHDLEMMLDLVTDDTRVVFIANPNNPTGTWLDYESLQGFIRAVPETTLVVVDEAYFEYVQEPTYPNAIKWLERYPHLIVIRTFSKIYGLAGLRIGYAVSHPEVADLLNRVRQPFNANSLAQSAARAALEDNIHVKTSIGVNSAGLTYLLSGFKERGLVCIPSVTNFVCVDIGRPALPVYQGLLLQGVIVRPVANYGLPNHLRITIGTQTQNHRVLQALDNVLKS